LQGQGCQAPLLHVTWQPLVCALCLAGDWGQAVADSKVGRGGS